MVKERLNLRISGSRLKKLRWVAQQREKTMTQLVEDWIDWLQEEKPPSWMEFAANRLHESQSQSHETH